MLAVNVSANQTYVHIYVSQAEYHSYKMCHMTLTLHVYYMTFTLEGWWDDGGVTGDKATKPATAVRDLATISRRGNKKLILLTGGRVIVSQVRADQNRYFKPGHNVFQTVTKWFWCLNLTRTWEQLCEERNRKKRRRAATQRNVKWRPKCNRVSCTLRSTTNRKRNANHITFCYWDNMEMLNVVLHIRQVIKHLIIQ